MTKPTIEQIMRHEYFNNKVRNSIRFLAGEYDEYKILDDLICPFN